MKFFCQKSFLLLALMAALSLFLGGCGGTLEELLEDILNGGAPAADDISGGDEDIPQYVPDGTQLYCITNVGHALVVFNPETQTRFSDIQKSLELDPVGPWFSGGRGFYLSRVDTSGAGANALVEFDPRTLVEVNRLNFPPNSNPTTLQFLSGGAIAYVALRGSTFDNFATNGISVVSLGAGALIQSAFLNLTTFSGGTMSSLVGFFRDDACPGGCVYAVANNWQGMVRMSNLLVLAPAGLDAPLVTDIISLGDNAVGAMMLDAQGELWVVNNGGYADYGGGDGSLMVLDTSAFADGVAGNELITTLALPGDPTAIYQTGPNRAWVTTYPDETLRTVLPDTNTLTAPDPALPATTGPFYETVSGLFAGSGGYGNAFLSRLDPSTGAFISSHPLEAGNGSVSCTGHTLP